MSIKYKGKQKPNNEGQLQKGFLLDKSNVKIKAKQADDGKYEDLVFEGFITNDGKDRAGDVLTLDGWELDAFKDNPIVLYNHGHDKLGGFPIGQAIHVEEVPERGIFAKVRFLVNALTEPIIEAIAKGFLKGFSVGFIPKDGRYDDKNDTYFITKKELMEFSVVSIPCLSSALGTVGVKSFNDYKSKTGDILNVLKKRWAIQAKIKEASDDKQEGTVVQTLIFNKEMFTQEQAIAWAKEHDFKSDKVDETDESFRLRQLEPGMFVDDSFKTIELTEGVQAVIGILKEQEAGGDKPKQDKLMGVTGEAEGHTHDFGVNDVGNGQTNTTSEGEAHTHIIQEFKVQEAGGHAHALDKESLLKGSKGVNDDLRQNPPAPTTVQDDHEPLQKTVEEQILTAMQTQTAILGLILDQLKTLTDVASSKGKLAGQDGAGSTEPPSSSPDGSTTGNQSDDEAKAWAAIGEGFKALASAK